MADSYSPLEDDELAGLADVLASGRVSPTAMDIGMLDGFLTAVASGPRPVPAERWLPWVWDAERGLPDMEEGASREARALVDLVVRHLHGIALALDEDPDAFEPLFYEEEVDDDVVEVPDAWCAGFVKAVELDAEGWKPLTDEFPSFFHALRLFGTEQGADEMEAMPDLEDRYEALIDEVEASVRAIQAFWRARRGQPPVSDAGRTAGLLDEDAPDTPAEPDDESEREGAPGVVPTEGVTTSLDLARASSPVLAPPRRREAPKVGRNDPCPCGSGKKFKSCHGRG